MGREEYEIWSKDRLKLKKKSRISEGRRHSSSTNDSTLLTRKKEVDVDYIRKKNNLFQFRNASVQGQENKLVRHKLFMGKSYLSRNYLNIGV
jgi:hypothetical protein